MPKSRGIKALFQIYDMLNIFQTGIIFWIEENDHETAFQLSACESLKWRRKGQKLSTGEWKEIYEQINKGKTIREIKETYQLSSSTIK